MIVPVRHPSALLHVPKGARKERLDFRQVTTPVDLREVPLEAFRHLLTVPGRMQGDSPHELYEHGGSLWTKIQGWGDGMPADQIGLPFGREAFAGFLAGTLNEKAESWSHHTDLAEALRRSPVEAEFEAGPLGKPIHRVSDAYHPRGFQSLSYEHSRGTTLDPSASRSVRWDREAESALEVARFLDERFAIAGDAVFHKLDGPHARYVRGNAHSYNACVFPRDLEDRWSAVPLADVARHMRSPEVTGYPIDSRTPPKVSPSLDRLLASEVPSLALAPLSGFMANHLPSLALRSLTELVQSAHKDVRDDLEAITAPLEPLVVRGMTGAIPHSEAAAIATMVTDVINESIRRHGTHLSGWDARTVLKSVDGFLADAPYVPTEEDTDALATIFPAP